MSAPATDSNGNPSTRDSPPAQEYVTVTLGDGNTVEIPKKEITFQNVDFSHELQGVVVQQDNVNNNQGTNGSATNVRRNSPPMPDVDVSSDVQSVHELDDTTISTASMMATDPTTSVPLPAELPVDIDDKDAKYGKKYSRKWKEMRETSKEDRDKTRTKAETWRSKIHERKVAARVVVKWREYVQKCKEERRQVGITMLKKARERKRQRELQQQKEESKTEAADESVKKSPDTEQKEEIKKSASDMDVQNLVKTDSTISADDKELTRKRSSQDLKAAILKVQPKMSMMKRKGAPPILSLPGDPDAAKKNKIAEAKKAAFAAKDTKKEEVKEVDTQPGPSKAAAPDPGGDDGPPDGSPDGDDKDKKEEKKDDEEKKAKVFKEGDPQKMAGRIILACKRGDYMTVEALVKESKTKGLDTRLVTENLGWNPLHFAAKDNRVISVDLLIEAGYHVNSKAKDGSTPLHLACLYAREDTIRMLLLRGADAMMAGGPKGQAAIHILSSKSSSNAVASLQLILRSCPKEVRLFTDSEGNIALFCAIETLNHAVCRELLLDATKEQLDYKKPDTGETAIFYAVKKKDLELLRLFSEYGSNVDVQNKNGETILHHVCSEGMDVFARYLCKVGANPNLKDLDEKTPLHIATEKGNHKLVELLVDKFRASVHERTKDGSTLMHLASQAGNPLISAVFIKKGVPLYMPNKKGVKAIHLAAMTGNLDMVKSVLDKGEKVDIRTKEGFTALHLAVQNNKPNIVEVLLGHGADVALKAGKLKETPLHLCSKVVNGHVSADLLIKSGAPINEANEAGETAFHVAARHGNVPTAMMLLLEGADFTLLNANGENVMHILTKACHFQLTQNLLQFVTQKSSKDSATKLVNQRNKNGESSVHYAASLKAAKVHYQFEDRDLVRLLLQTGGDPMLEATETRETSVHYCSKSGNINVLDEILATMQSTDAQTACNKQAKNGWSPLLYACYHGHPEIIKKLLSQNARVDVFDEMGRASLHLAAELGHEDVIKLLLENNAFVNVRNKLGHTPLHLAAQKGYNNMVKSLVNDGAVVDALSLTKQTPLHLAAESGHLQVCLTLLQLKADVNALDSMAETPLHLAAQSDHPEVLKLFLQTKPELVSVPNKNGQTCAHIAAEKGSVAVLKELMKFNVETVKTARIKKTGNTALHLACEGGHVKVVRQLLQAGAKASDENSEGFTALHCAARNGHLRVLASLKGSTDWKVCSRKNGFTALHIAAKYGQTDFVSEMLTQVPAGIKSERSLNDPNGDYGITPLHMAAQNGHEATVRLLMNSKGVHIDEPTTVNASTPMHYAAAGGHLLVAGLIISRSSESLKITDKNGKTCVHVAAAAGHREMVSLLVGQGAEINAQDKKLWTPLHYAARYGYLDVVELLVDSGADPMATSKDEKIPLCCAAGAGHYEVISYLLKKEHDTLALMEDRTFMLDLMAAAKTHSNKPLREFILVSEAPIDTAVKLAKCYENMSLRDKERSKDLEAACHFCDQVAIDLLTVTATFSNPTALLRGIDHKQTEFLDVLIELERKDVVAQHAVQRFLTEVWMGRLKWKGSWFVGLFLSFLICPLIWVAVSIPIGHNLGKKPIIKFTSYLTSHILFIALLIYTTLNVQLPLFEYKNLIPYWFEWLLFSWIIGILVSEITNPSDRSGLGAIKTIILVVSFAAVSVHVGAMFAHIFYYSIDFTANEQMYHALYIRNQMFAFALLLSFIEFLNFLTFHPLFGPWGVIIQDLIKDLLLFMAILAIFLAGFTLQVCAIYQPVYRPPSNNNGSIPEIGSVFQSPALTFEMLFYALFGLVEPDSMPPMHLNPPFSKYIMKLVFGVFMMVTVIVLINLLIAMMSNTYQRIEAQSDIEWKFGRAKLIRNMNRTLPTPSPINLFAGIPLLLAEKIQRYYGNYFRLTFPSFSCITS